PVAAPTRSALADGLPAAATLPDAAAPDAASGLLSHDGGSGDRDVAEASSTAVLTGSLVHDADDSPIPDVPLEIFVDITDTVPQSGTRIEARSAADGSLRVELEHAVRVWLVRALPGDGHALVELRPELEVALGSTEHIELRAKRGAVVRGQVVDEVD